MNHRPNRLKLKNKEPIVFYSITCKRNALLFIVCVVPALALASSTPGDNYKCVPAHNIEIRLPTGDCIYDDMFGDCDGDDYEEDGCGHELAETAVDGECVFSNRFTTCLTMDENGNKLKTVLLVHQGEEICDKPTDTATECNCYIIQDWPPILVPSTFDDCRTL